MDSLSGMELHQAIKQMRLNRKVTQKNLSDSVGVSTFTLIRWERGERLPDGKFLSRLAQTLGYAIVLSTDGLWSCYPDENMGEGEKSSMKNSYKAESADEVYRKAVEAKDKAVWNVFFSRLVENNAELEAWFRKSDGGKGFDEKKFKMMSDVLLALVKAE